MTENAITVTDARLRLLDRPPDDETREILRRAALRHLSN